MRDNGYNTETTATCFLFNAEIAKMYRQDVRYFLKIHLVKKTYSLFVKFDGNVHWISECKNDIASRTNHRIDGCLFFPLQKTKIGHFHIYWIVRYGHHLYRLFGIHFEVYANVSLNIWIAVEIFRFCFLFVRQTVQPFNRVAYIWAILLYLSWLANRQCIIHAFQWRYKQIRPAVKIRTLIWTWIETNAQNRRKKYEFCLLY